MEPQKQQNDPPPIKENHFYRCMPNLYSPEIIGGYLIDFYERYVQFFSIKDFTLQKRIAILQKEDQYCAQIGVVSDSIIIVYGAQKFYVVNIKSFEVVQKIKVSSYIQKSQTKSSHVVILNSEQESDNKLINCWKIDPQTGKVDNKYKATRILEFQDQDCNEQNIRICLIISIDNTPRVYVYWENTSKMIEINPIRQQSQQYERQQLKIKYITDLSSKTYGEIVDNKINVHVKEGGKRIAQLINQGQNFIQIFSDGSEDTIYSLSNLGIKKWKLQSNVEPIFYDFSDKYKIQKVYFTGVDQIIGINNDSKNIVIWKTPDECEAHNFPNQIVRKIVKFNETIAVFLLEVTSITQEEDDDRITKYNKLQVYDFVQDRQIAKKAINKTQFSVDMDSLLVSERNIRFIVNQETQNPKKYLFKWTPPLQESNKEQKDTKKKQIKEASNFDWIKLYNFNRMIAVCKPKQEEAYSVFAKKAQKKTQLVIFDYALKKLGDYDLNGQIQGIELSQNSQIISILSDKVNIYALKTEIGEKNRLQKINQLDISVISLKVYKNYLLVRKQSNFLLLDDQFECVMMEDIDKDDKQYKMIPYAQNCFLLKTEKTIAIWDHQKQSIQKLEIPQCEPVLTEFMSQKIIIVDQWVEAYDVKFTN